MKRPIILLLTLLLIVGCSRGGSKPSDLPAPPETRQPGPPAAAPAEPTLATDPVYLLSAPQQPLWKGPVTVVVENSPQARPQAGLQEADLVVEALSESEISRFLAFYWSRPTAKIGPVRSARTGFVAMADAYNAPFAHAGGNTDALAILQTQWGARDLDEIYNAGPFFVRASDREMPHNLYTSTKLLDAAITARKIALEAVPVTARSSEPPRAGERAVRVEVDWHRLHKVQWEWQTERYLRSEDGEPHRAEGGQQLSAVNLIFMEVTGTNNGPDLGWALDLDRGGKATILVAGHLWEGAWRLEEGGFRLLPPTGGTLPVLAPGATWAHLITQESSFTVSGK